MAHSQPLEHDGQPRNSGSLARHRAPFAVVLAAGFMTLLDVSIVNVALPSIEAALGAGPDQLQWIVAGYALAFGLVLVAAGRFGDIFGRKRLFLIGLSAFVLASLGCGLAPSAQWLAGMRFVQGVAAGILNPQVLGMMQEMFQGKARARAFGIFGIIVGISTALGPVLGGVLISLVGAQHGWRLVFLINVPIGLVVVPLAVRWLPRTRTRAQIASELDPQGGGGPGKQSLASQFDLGGVLLLGAIVLCIMLPFLESSSEARNTGATAPYWLLAVATALSVVLAFWERWWRSRGGSALLDPELLRSPSFVLGMVAAFFYFGGFTSIFLVVTLYLQQGLGWTALAAGAAAVPFALLSGASSGISGALVNSFGRWVPVWGSALVALSFLAAAAAATWLSPSAAPWGVIAATAVAGVGSGMMISPNQALTLDGVPLRMAGLAAALLQTFQRLGTAIGLSVVTTAYFVTLAHSPAQSAPALASSQALAAGALVISGIVALAVVANVADLRRRGAAVGQVADNIKGKARPPKPES